MALNTAPVISAIVEDTNSTTVYLTQGRSTGVSSTLIKYHSNARATMSATPQEGATINEDTCIIRNGGSVGFGLSCTFRNVESNVFTFSAEDDRGYTGTRTVTADMIDYVRLTCNIKSSRPDTNGDMRLSCTGNYFNDTFGAVENSLTVRYSYEGSDGSSGSGSMRATMSGNTYTAYADLSDLDYQVTYSFTVTAEDELETVVGSASGVKSTPVFHWGENDFAFEVPVAINSTEESRIKGNLRLKGDGDYGNKLLFGDGSFCYIAESADDEMVIKATALNLNAPTILFDGVPASGTWSPTLDYSSVNKYYTRKGWYLKLGNVVVLGWYVRADIEYNSHDIDVAIEGAPFTPTVGAFGGGVAYNIYTPAGFIFEGWGIDTDGAITPRLQPSNETEECNLEIASSAGYPYDGGTITLAGTICYMVE